MRKAILILFAVSAAFSQSKVPGTLTIAPPKPIWNNSTWVYSLDVSANGASHQAIVQGIQGAGQYTVDAIQAAVDCPSTSTNWECGGVAAAINNSSVTTNAVALRGYVVQSAAGTGTAG